jgi:hypothetical protein
MRSVASEERVGGRAGTAAQGKGRVRASQPACFLFCFPLHSVLLHPSAPQCAFLHSSRVQRCFYKLFSNECVKNSCEVQCEAFARQVVTINSIAVKYHCARNLFAIAQRQSAFRVES